LIKSCWKGKAFAIDIHTHYISSWKVQVYKSLFLLLLRFLLLFLLQIRLRGSVFLLLHSDFASFNHNVENSVHAFLLFFCHLCDSIFRNLYLWVLLHWSLTLQYFFVFWRVF
jgi:hypothetical protein